MDTNAAPFGTAVRRDEIEPRDGPRAAANVLEMAARDAEVWLAEARTEADALVSDARAEAESLVRAGHAEADRLTASARSEADHLLSDARAEAERVRAELEVARGEHADEVARLAQLKDDSRDQLRGHLTALLAQVDAPGPGSPRRSG
jgi:cell division septum initiation protein DivIVA